MKPESVAALREVVERTKKGEDRLNLGIIDIAFDQFIDIRKLVEQVLRQEGIG